MEKCADCGVERPSLNTHHIIPRSQGGTDEIANLVRLCPNCHEDRHGGPYGGTLSHGNKQTPEVRAKRAASMRARWQDPAYRARVTERREAAITPEVIARRSAAIRVAYQKDEVKQRVHERELRKWQQPGHRELMSAVQKARYTDPAERARTAEAVKAGIARSPKRAQWGRHKEP